MKKGDFVEVEYTGRLKEEGYVFDTTDEKTAKEAGIFQQGMKFGSVIVCLGEGQLLEGLERKLEGKDVGEFEFELSAEEGFGKKDAKLIKMIPASVFRKQGINPEQGLQVNVDGLVGVIKTAAGGRCLVDFNHPLSSKELVYKVKVNRIVEDDKEKLEGYLKLSMGMDAEVELKDGEAKVKVDKDIPKEAGDVVLNKVKELIPSIKGISFTK